MQIDIRPMQGSDIQALCPLYLKAYAARSEERWDLLTVEKLLMHIFKKQPELCFVSEVEKRTLGAIMGSVKPWWDGIHIVLEEIFVDPDFHKQGTGTALLKRLCESAQKDYSAVSIEAITFRDDEFPKGWYMSRGFEEIKEWMLIDGRIKNILPLLQKS